MSVLTPQPILRHLKDRLRQNYVPESLYSDEDILTLLNDAYLEACERSMCLRGLYTFTLVDGQQEYPLPSDFSAINFVCSAGVELFPMSLADGLAQQRLTPVALSTGYYTYNSTTIGFVPTPTKAAEDSATMMMYAAQPSPFITYDDGFDARFPVEFADLLVHFVRWRVQLISGGAERIQLAAVDRKISDTRVGELRRAADTVETVMPPQLLHVADMRRLRRVVS